MPQEYDEFGFPRTDAESPGCKTFVTAKTSNFMHYQRGESQHDAVWCLRYRRTKEWAEDISTVCGMMFTRPVIVSDEPIWSRGVCPKCLAAIDFEALSH